MNGKDKCMIFVQARLGSERLPQKVLHKINGREVIDYVLSACEKANCGEIALLTSDLLSDNPLAKYCDKRKTLCFRGSEADVLDRFYKAAKFFDAKVIARVCGDCPLIDSAVISKVVHSFYEADADYVSNTQKRSYPRGQDIEVFRFTALEKAYFEAKDKAQREHVTPYIYQHPELFTMKDVLCDSDYSQHRWTLDTEKDLQLIETLILEIQRQQKDLVMPAIIELLKEQPQWMQINSNVRQKTL